MMSLEQPSTSGCTTQLFCGSSRFPSASRARLAALLNASFSESYWDAHRRLEAKGVLDHPLYQCHDARGPREIHVWRAETGWRVHSAR
jgi:hypothetical protein